MNLYINSDFFSPNLFGSIYVNLTHRGNYTPSDAKLIKEETNLLKALGKNQVMPIFRKKKKTKLHIFSSLAFMPRKIAKLSKNFNEQWRHKCNSELNFRQIIRNKLILGTCDVIPPINSKSVNHLHL